MTYYTYTNDPIGCFTEKEIGNYFEYSDNPHSFSFCKQFPHIVWVGGGGIAGMNGYRYATVKKTVAYICVDEDEYGEPVLEKWLLKNNVKYDL